MRTPAPDVVVIGGGIVGVAAAAHLAIDGRRVLLVERERIGAGASGRNSGVVQHPFDPHMADLHLASLELYRDLEHRSSGTFGLPPTPAGLLYVTRDAAAARRASVELAATHPHLHPTFVAPGSAGELEPGLHPEVAACRLEIGYPVAPAAATQAYAAWARQSGVEVATGVVARPWLEAGRCLGVALDRGSRVPAADVLVAAGPWTPAIVDPSGDWRPIRPSWGVVVGVTLATPPRHVLEEAEMEIEPGDDPPAAGDGAATIDDGVPGGAAHDVEFSLVTADGASSLGTTFLADEPDPAAYVSAIVRRAATFVPTIADAVVASHRVCARPQSLDGRPLVGRVPGVEGLWIAAGNGPWGISTGPATGRLAADLLGGAAAAPPVALDPGRFGSPRI